MITVVVPVGPHPANKRYLAECFASIGEQVDVPLTKVELLVVDDQAHLTKAAELWDIIPTPLRGHLRVERPATLLGVALAFNWGIATAKNDAVFMLGSDDRLEPTCLAKCIERYRKIQDPAGYYWVDVAYSDGRQQSLPCHAAMITKGLYGLTGGFPITSNVGACDSMLISIMMVHLPNKIHHVPSEEPLYWYRVHDETETARNGPRFQAAIHQIRDAETRFFVRPTWTNF